MICGLSVTTGKGVCRNIAAHFRDVLRVINRRNRLKRTELVGTNIDYNRNIALTLSELPEEFKINISKEKSSLESGTESEVGYENYVFLPNHAEVIVMDNMDKKDSPYTLMLYDPTNIRITKINYTQRVSERIAIDFRCEMWNAYSHFKTLEDRINFLEHFGKIASIVETSKREEYSKQDLKYLIEYARKQCNNSRNDIETFYQRYGSWYTVIKRAKDSYIKNQNQGEDPKQGQNR